ncbi:unnamed protein product [Ceratitis capitata]|uniref:(Mediterranean fruit fly) hypothetical protein n=1 Tax=Ceratitis capitata TaxID=7213 RepID=A0A811UDH3_CERCA|nr:unnamed protein product [Ceratitis capitata]
MNKKSPLLAPTSEALHTSTTFLQRYLIKRKEEEEEEEEEKKKKKKKKKSDFNNEAKLRLYNSLKYFLSTKFGGLAQLAISPHATSL